MLVKIKNLGQSFFFLGVFLLPSALVFSIIFLILAASIGSFTNKNNYFAEKLIFSSGAWIKNLVPSLNLPIKIERQVLFWFDPLKDKDQFHYSNMPNTGWDLDNGIEFYTQPIIEDKGFKVAMHHNGKFISEDNLNRESNMDDLNIVKNFPLC